MISLQDMRVVVHPESAFRKEGNWRTPAPQVLPILSDQQMESLKQEPVYVVNDATRPVVRIRAGSPIGRLHWNALPIQVDGEVTNRSVGNVSH